MAWPGLASLGVGRALAQLRHRAVCSSLPLPPEAYESVALAGAGTLSQPRGLDLGAEVHPPAPPPAQRMAAVCQEPGIAVPSGHCLPGAAKEHGPP
jgi:hypothetical protein